MDATARSNRRHSGISRLIPFSVRRQERTPRCAGRGWHSARPWPRADAFAPARVPAGFARLWLRPPAGLVGNAGGWVSEAAGHAASGDQAHSSPRFLQARLSFWMAPPTDLPLRRLPYRCSLTACCEMPRRAAISRWFMSARK